MTSRLGVLYDVAAAQQRVTSLFGGGGGLHIAPPGNVTHWRFGPRNARRDVTVTGGGLHIAQLGSVRLIVQCGVCYKQVRSSKSYACRHCYGGGLTLHNLGACGLSYNGACVTYSIGRCMRETGASRTATRDVTVRPGFTYCTTAKR